MSPITYSLEDLLPADVLQARVQVLDPRLDVHQLVLVGTLDNARLADCHVEAKLDAAVRVGGAVPTRLAAVGRREEADHVVAGLVGGESEAATGAALLRNYTVIVVKEFLFAQGQYAGLSSLQRPEVGPCIATDVHQQ